MKKLIENRKTFTLLWLPIIFALYYLDETVSISRNKQLVVGMLSFIFYLLISCRLLLLNFNRKLLYGFIFIITIHFIMGMIGFLINSSNVIFSLVSINAMAVIILVLVCYLLILYCCLYAIFTKNRAMI